VEEWRGRALTDNGEIGRRFAQNTQIKQVNLAANQREQHEWDSSLWGSGPDFDLIPLIRVDSRSFPHCVFLRKSAANNS
jgi:hypothetical protein